MKTNEKYFPLPNKNNSSAVLFYYKTTELRCSLAYRIEYLLLDMAKITKNYNLNEYFKNTK